MKGGCEGSTGPPVAWGTHQEGPPERIVLVTAMTYDSERAQSKISKQKGMWVMSGGGLSQASRAF